MNFRQSTMRGSRGGLEVRTSWKIAKTKGSLSNTKKPSIPRWAIIDTSAKRYLMAFRWWADDGPLIMVLGSSLLKKQTQRTVSLLDSLWQNSLDLRMDYVSIANCGRLQCQSSGQEVLSCLQWPGSNCLVTWRSGTWIQGGGVFPH